MPQQPQNFAWSEAEAQARIEAARRDGATALSGLRLRTVPESVLDLPGLGELKLSHNRLRDLPDVLLRMRDLVKLDLSDNLLLELPDWLGELRDLADLDVGGNRTTGIAQRTWEVVLARAW